MQKVSPLAPGGSLRTFLLWWSGVCRQLTLRAIGVAAWRSDRLVVLYAHDVADQSHDLCVPTELFTAQVRTLAEDGWQVTTLREAIGAWGKPGRRLALCFDDAYEGVLTNALPVLNDHGFRATVFACPGFAGKHPAWPGSDDYVEAARAGGRTIRLLSLDQLADLHRRGWEVGGHTVNHVDLCRLSAGAAHAEIAESLRTLQSVIGEPVTSFAYPYGSADERLAQVAAGAGVTAACLTRLGHARPKANRLLLPRLHLSPEINPATLRAMVSPLFPVYLRAAAGVRRLLGRADPAESGRPRCTS